MRQRRKARIHSASYTKSSITVCGRHEHGVYKTAHLTLTLRVKLVPT